MQIWILEAGEWDDVQNIAVVIGTKREAEKAAEAITQRRKAGEFAECDQVVRIAPIKRVDQHGEVVR